MPLTTPPKGIPSDRYPIGPSRLPAGSVSRKRAHGDTYLRRSPTATVARPSARRTGKQRWVAWASRNRRLAVALLLAVAAGIAVHHLSPVSEQRVAVLSASRDLPVGTAVVPGDLVLLDVPPEVVPAGSFSSPSSVEGRQLASPLRKGQIATDAQLLGPGLLAGAPPGTVAVPLRLADPSSLQLVSPGQLVNVVVTEDHEFGTRHTSEELAAAVPVLWTPSQGGKPGQWLGTGETDGLLVVAADQEQSARITGASTWGKLFFVLVNGPPH